MLSNKTKTYALLILLLLPFSAFAQNKYCGDVTPVEQYFQLIGIPRTEEGLLVKALYKDGLAMVPYKAYIRFNNKYILINGKKLNKRLNTKYLALAKAALNVNPNGIDDFYGISFDDKDFRNFVPEIYNAYIAKHGNEAKYIPGVFETYNRNVCNLLSALQTDNLIPKPSYVNIRYNNEAVWLNQQKLNKALSRKYIGMLYSISAGTPLSAEDYYGVSFKARDCEIYSKK